jgi:RHS repeat-associated protein
MCLGRGGISESRGAIFESASNSSTKVYDGDRIAVEYDGSGNLLRRYAYGLGGDNPIVWYEGAAVGQSNRRYLHANHEGSIIAVTDGNGGTLAINRYDPFGIRGSSNQGRFQYTGQAYVPELGLYYYKARMYNATLARFMQTDPVGYTGDLDLYTYVGNDPLDGTDPSGEICIGAGQCIDPAPPPPAPTALAAITITATRVGAARLVLPVIGVVSATVGVAVISGLFPSRLGSNDTCDNGQCGVGSNTMQAKQAKGKKKSKTGVGGQEGAKDVPSWAKGERPNTGESGKDFADRIVGEKYGKGNYPTGPGSEFSKIRKWGDRSFTD